jgi:hypothetical protein
MRFESKHQRAKRLVDITCNFTNVPRSIAIHHQLDIAATMFTEPAQFSCKSDVIIGPGNVVTLSELDNGVDIHSCIESIGIYTEILLANWIEVNRIRYKPDVVY